MPQFLAPVISCGVDRLYGRHLELTEEFPASSISIAAISINGSGLPTPTLEPAWNPTPDGHCLWCGRTFTPRMTGGSSQKFCCTAHRQQFWIAARRWTMRAIDAGLLSVDA